MIINNSIANRKNYFRINKKKVVFSGNKKPETKEDKYKNPIKSSFEYLDATKAAALASLAVIARILSYDDGDLIFGLFDNKPKKDDMFVNAKEKANMNKKVIGIISGAFAVAFGAVFLLKLPEYLNKARKDTFVKKKEMDVYTREKEAEKNMFSAIDKKAQTATDNEKTALVDKYLKLKVAKSKPPTFVFKKK